MMLGFKYWMNNLFTFMYIHTYLHVRIISDTKRLLSLLISAMPNLHEFELHIRTESDENQSEINEVVDLMVLIVEKFTNILLNRELKTEDETDELLVKLCLHDIFDVLEVHDNFVRDFLEPRIRESLADQYAEISIEEDDNHGEVIRVRFTGRTTDGRKGLKLEFES